MIPSFVKCIVAVDGRIVTGPVCAIGTVWIGRQTESRFLQQMVRKCLAACNLVRSHPHDDDGNAVDLDRGIVEVSVSQL